MIELYTQQLRRVLQQYKNKYSDIFELLSAKSAVEIKSKDGTYKSININEINNRLKELTQNSLLQ